MAVALPGVAEYEPPSTTHWYVGNLGSVSRRNAWRYKYYELNLNDYGKAYDAYKLINGMAPKLKELFILC